MKRIMLCFVCVSSFILFNLSQSAHAMGNIPKKQYQAKVDELQECGAKFSGAQEELGRSKTRITELETTNASLAKEFDLNKGDVQKKIESLIKEKEELEKQKADEVGKLKSTYDNLVSDMKKEIDQGSVQITQLQDKLSVSMVDKIVFNSGESELNDQGKQVLKRVANILKKVKGKQIRIEGHTDNIPIGGALKDKFPSNWELSTARATSVSRYLQDSGGIDPQYLVAAGYSQFRPVADNSKPEGRAKNRRIEIALVPLETASASPAPAPEKKPAATPEKKPSAAPAAVPAPAKKESSAVPEKKATPAPAAAPVPEKK